MHRAVLLVVRWIAVAHDRWIESLARRPLSGEVARLALCIQRLEVENAILRARLLRVPGRHRPHYRPHERLDILWHRARHHLSIAATAAAFAVAPQTILNWIRVADRRHQRLVQPDGGLHRLPDLVAHLVHRLKAEWPAWGTRRIAGVLARLGVKASRTSVQRLLRRRPSRPPPSTVADAASAGVLLAKHPNHLWMLDFTRIGGFLRPLWLGAVLDSFSRKVLSIGVVPGGPSARFAATLLRRAVARHGAPLWLVTDRDPALRSRLVNTFITRWRVRRWYGAVGRKGSIALIERTWRSLKQEYVRHIFLHVSERVLERKLLRWARWFNAERPHQGLGKRTPDEVYRRKVPKGVRNVTAGMLSVRFLDGDPCLPILRLTRAA